MKKKHFYLVCCFKGSYWFVFFFFYYFLSSCAATVTQFPPTGIRIWSAITVPDSLSRGTHREDGPKWGNIQNNHQLQLGEFRHVSSVLAEGEGGWLGWELTVWIRQYYLLIHFKHCENFHPAFLSKSTTVLRWLGEQRPRQVLSHASNEV